MSVVVVTPPVHEIDLDLVKAHLRVDHDDDDTLIGAFVGAAVSHIDGRQGWLGRAIWPQTLELRQNVFCSPIRLPYGPATTVVTVKYVDPDGTEQTLASDQYVLTNAGELDRAYNASWPNLRGDAEGVRVRYTAGYETLPASILSAVLIMVGDLYKSRESTGADGQAVQMSTTVQNLLAPFRVWSV